MTDANNNPMIQESANKKSAKKSLLVRLAIFLILAIGVMYLTLGTIKYANRSDDVSMLELIPEIPPASAKNKLFAQSLAQADTDLRQTLLTNQPNQAFGKKAGQLGELYHGNDFYPQALACYEIAMDYDPQNPLWPHHSAMLKQMTGETESVVGLLKRTIELTDGYQPAVLKLADIYYKMGDHDHATIYYQKCLDIDPGDQFALLGLGRIALDSSKWLQAQQYLEKTIESNHKFETAYHLLALVHKHFGRTELMNSVLEKAAQPPKVRKPIPPDPWIDEVDLLCHDPGKVLGLSDKAITMHDVELGLKFLHRALELEVDDLRFYDLYLRFAKKLIKSGNKKLAQDFFKKAIQIDPEDDEAYQLWGTHLINEFKPQQAEQKLLKAFQIDPENANTNYLLGTSSFLQAHFQKTISFYTRAFEIDPELDVNEPGLSMGRELILNPNDPQHYIATVNKLVASGNREVSKKFFEKIIELDPHQSKICDKLGLILMSEQKFQQAERMFLKALESAPENATARLHLAQALFENNQIRSALQQYRILLQTNPDSLNALNSLAWILATTEDANTKDPAQAVKLAERACEITRYKNPQILDTLAVAYAADGQFQKAIETAQKALALTRSSGNQALAIKIQKRIELYEANQPYREPLPEKTRKN